MQTILSYGMGVESTAILVRWLEDASVRPCSLDELIVITSHTGDEYADTYRDVETSVLPLLRKHRVRYVQVARAGSSQTDGIVVLSDSRGTGSLFWDGAYKLSDELRKAGTVPQFGGEHICSLKFKAWVIERWFAENLAQPARHAFGYNATETKRVAKSEAANARRVAFGFNAEEHSAARDPIRLSTTLCGDLSHSGRVSSRGSCGCRVQGTLRIGVVRGAVEPETTGTVSLGRMTPKAFRSRGIP